MNGWSSLWIGLLSSRPLRWHNMPGRPHKVNRKARWIATLSNWKCRN